MALSSRLRTARASWRHVDDGDRRRRGRAATRTPRGRRQRPRGGERIGHQVGRAGPARGPGRRAPGVDPGQLEQVVDHAGQPVGLAAASAVVAATSSGRSTTPSSSASAIARMPGQRGAQVVAHPGHQLAAGGSPAGLAPAGRGSSPGWARASSSATAPSSAPARGGCAATRLAGAERPDGAVRAARRAPAPRPSSAASRDRGGVAATSASSTTPQGVPGEEHHPSASIHGGGHDRDHGERRHHDQRDAQRPRRTDRHARAPPAGRRRAALPTVRARTSSWSRLIRRPTAFVAVADAPDGRISCGGAAGPARASPAAAARAR